LNFFLGLLLFFAEIQYNAFSMIHIQIFE